MVLKAGSGTFAKSLFWPSGFSGRKAQAEECWLAQHSACGIDVSTGLGLQSQAQTGARVNDGCVDVAAVGHTAFVSLVPFRNLVSWVLLEAADPWIWQSVLR